MARQYKGRKPGGRNRGYFYRKGRGWASSRGVPLRDEHGETIRDRDASATALRAAFTRLQQTVVEDTPDNSGVTVLEVCQAYLDVCETTGSPNTFAIRAAALFNFCFGLPAGLRGKENLTAKQLKSRLHPGFGKLSIEQLKKLHVDQWIKANPKWKNSRRTMIHALKRAMNYGVECGLITVNPIKGYKSPATVQRMTYITPEQEAAMYRLANPAVALALKVCIRTGARYGCEFIKLTANHVTTTPRGMEWRFSVAESKTNKLRVIRISNTEPAAKEIIGIVTALMKRYPQGTLFRNTHGDPWGQVSLGDAFRRLKEKLAKEGILLDKDACMYSTRHTYAKRTLSGYWTGKPCTIEQLSALMGNSRDVCWKHYASWCDAYTDPLR